MVWRQMRFQIHDPFPSAPVARHHKTMYEPERIIKSVRRRGKVHYQVRWKGFGAESDTVEPEGNLPPWLLEQFRCDSGVVHI